MAPADDYCDLCDLPLSQCVHGNPPTPPPAPAPKAPRAPRTRSTSTSAGTAGTSTRAPRATPTRTPPAGPPRRRTPAEDFEPLIIAVLGALGGEAAAEDVMETIGERMADSFRASDQEKGPTGELRWRTACRTARKNLADAGRLVAPQPGVWRLTD